MVAAAVLVAGAAACSEDPDPQVAPPDPPTPTVTTTPASGPVAPTLPPEAEGDDAAAAEAFVRFYWEMADYAQATGDVSGLKALGAEGCRPCAAGVAFVEEVYDGRGSIRGGETDVSNLSTTKIKVAGDIAYQVRLNIRTTDQDVDRDPGTKKDQFFPGGTVKANFVVRSVDGKWLAEFWEIG
ncbi:DUF6318 family protein [Nocardioides ochotonae]|uniref:DUF6318 family protein n=1 Tax=Nocardioides ochotonae TaxID=2685869 RepID=UPI00140D6550|nr:DUF6318 family protein [Nocardioides ochotonae]